MLSFKGYHVFSTSISIVDLLNFTQVNTGFDFPPILTKEFSLILTLFLHGNMARNYFDLYFSDSRQTTLGLRFTYLNNRSAHGSKLPVI